MNRFTLALAASLLPGAAFSQTEITFWHAMGGALGDTVNQIAVDFNASQSDYVLTPVFKGTYEEALTAGIAAFRAGEQPNILQDYANTSSAGSIIAFSKYSDDLAAGDRGLICSFGAGYSVGSLLVTRV